MYFDSWYHFEDIRGLVVPMTSKQTSLQKSALFSWQYYVQYDTPKIIGDFHYPVKTAKVSDYYWFHFYFREIEQNIVNDELL